MFGIYRNFNREVKFLSLILFIYQLLINFNMTLVYVMVKFLNVKVNSIPIEDGFFLVGVTATIYYVLFTMLMLIVASWRIKSIDEALLQVDERNERKLLKKLKIILKVWSKVEDLNTSMTKYFITNNLFYFSNFFNTFLITVFLGYDIFAHSLEIDDKIFLMAAVIFCISSISCIIILTINSEIYKNKNNKAMLKFNLIKLKSKDKRVQSFCYLGILQLKNSSNFISCGLFDLNWKHVFAMISSFFAYLVMIIQFDYMLTTKNINILSN